MVQSATLHFGKLADMVGRGISFTGYVSVISPSAVQCIGRVRLLCKQKFLDLNLSTSVILVRLPNYRVHRALTSHIRTAKFTSISASTNEMQNNYTEILIFLKYFNVSR